MTETQSEAIALEINGAQLAVGQRPNLSELDPALRGVALSDSPVLIRASASDGTHLVDRLHALGRRAALPVHDCRSPAEAEALFRAVRSTGDTDERALGTWALHGVDAWPSELQEDLSRILGALDEGRLHGRLRHDKIPRVVVVERPGAAAGALSPELERRLSFFKVATKPHTKLTTKPTTKSGGKK